MALTKLNTSASGPTGIPNPDPVSTAQGGPEGVGGSANTINAARVKATEPANDPGAGSNTNLFNPWSGSSQSEPSETNTAPAGGGKPSNVNLPYPAGNHLITGTDLPSTTGAATGRIMRGGRGRPGK